MHVGVILTQQFRGGVLRGAVNVAKMLASGASKSKEPFRVTLGILADTYTEFEFTDLGAMGINVREFRYKTITSAEGETAFALTGTQSLISDDYYIILNDGISCFLDCDHWLFVADRVPGTILPLRPFSIIAYDYLQRYIPGIVKAGYEQDYLRFLVNTRSANALFVTTPQTANDLVNYAGVARSKVHLIQPEFYIPEQYKALKRREGEPYFIWTTNASEHKNHFVVLEALNNYFNLSSVSIPCYVTGANTELFDVWNVVDDDIPADSIYIKNVRKALRKSSLENKQIKFLGNVDESVYFPLLASAHFLLHAASYDNGTFSILEAAYYGVPSVSSDYPATRFQSDKFGLNLRFFSSYSSSDLELRLREMTAARFEREKQGPTRVDLRDFFWENRAFDFFAEFQGAIACKSV